ncbi:hypothetical protein [Telluria aromaticivorans]|uniref:Uncharacterized protein n=1 Tax=Telluria aromaticivorans TaxID=2725995 RepID=A0A7Y2K1N7_9BURK|nr:hypothetical protein [Telluria aromaticivorans]NNG24990.1 hypothetical protein [Telluria aromaticivorans]
MKANIVNIICALGLIFIAGCSAVFGQISMQTASPTAPTLPTRVSAMVNDSLFQEIPLDTSTQNICSPTDPGINWRGISLRAPSRVVLPEKSADDAAFIIPICGLYLVDLEAAFNHPGHQILVATDVTSGDIFKGEIVKYDTDRTIPPPRSRPVKPSKNQAFGSYFNINAVDYIKLPLVPARYRITVEYAGYQSNEIDIEVVQLP